MQSDYNLNVYDYKILKYLDTRSRTKYEVISKFKRGVNAHLLKLHKNGYISTYFTNTNTSYVINTEIIFITEKGIVAIVDKHHETKNEYEIKMIGYILSVTVTAIIAYFVVWVYKTIHLI